jgi:hypothetical protein
MSFSFRSVAVVLAVAGPAHAAASGDDKPAQFLIGAVPASAWVSPALLTAAPQAPAKTAPALASFLPSLPSSFFGASTPGSSHLLFLSPLSPLRAALRVAAQDLAVQTLTAFEAAPVVANDVVTPEDPQAAADAAAASRRREVLLRQRRKSVLNEREAGVDRTTVAEAQQYELDTSGLSGRVELLALPSGAPSAAAADHAIPGGAGVVSVAGYLTDDLSFALTGLAADSAATTWRAGAEFELAAGDSNRVEVGAVYGSRFNANATPIGGEVDRRSVGAFRVVHALQLFDNVTTRAGGRFIDAPFLHHSRSIDPELSLLIEDPETDPGSRMYMRFDVVGDTLFPGLEVVTGANDVIALSEGLPILARDFEAQRTWTRGAAIGFRKGGTRVETRLMDQSVTHALLVHPSSVAGAPYVQNGNRNRAQMGAVLLERTFADGQAQAGVEYGFGHFAEDQAHPGRANDFHQVTTRFDAYLRRSGTGIAVFHRFHEGASVATYEGDARPRQRAQRYLVELRQNVPFVPDMIGADMAVLLSLRNVYYDDVDRRNIDEFAVAAPPRRITGGIRVKF